MQREIFRQLIAVLGCSPQQRNHLIDSLSQVLCEEPRLSESNGWYQFFDYPLNGITLDYNQKLETFVALTIWLNFQGCAQPDSDDREIGKVYSGDLPFGITQADTQKTIKSKLPGGSTKIDNFSPANSNDTFVFETHFDAENDRLLFVSIDINSRITK